MLDPNHPHLLALQHQVATLQKELQHRTLSLYNRSPSMRFSASPSSLDQHSHCRKQLEEKQQRIEQLERRVNAQSQTKDQQTVNIAQVLDFTNNQKATSENLDLAKLNFSPCQGQTLRTPGSTARKLTLVSAHSIHFSCSKKCLELSIQQTPAVTLNHLCFKSRDLCAVPLPPQLYVLNSHDRQNNQRTPQVSQRNEMIISQVKKVKHKSFNKQSAFRTQLPAETESNSECFFSDLSKQNRKLQDQNLRLRKLLNEQITQINELILQGRRVEQHRNQLLDQNRALEGKLKQSPSKIQNYDQLLGLLSNLSGLLYDQQLLIKLSLKDPRLQSVVHQLKLLRMKSKLAESAELKTQQSQSELMEQRSKVRVLEQQLQQVRQILHNQEENFRLQIQNLAKISQQNREELEAHLNELKLSYSKFTSYYSDMIQGLSFNSDNLFNKLQEIKEEVCQLQETPVRTVSKIQSLMQIPNIIETQQQSHKSQLQFVRLKQKLLLKQMEQAQNKQQLHRLSNQSSFFRQEIARLQNQLLGKTLREESYSNRLNISKDIRVFKQIIAEEQLDPPEIIRTCSLNQESQKQLILKSQIDFQRARRQELQIKLHSLQSSDHSVRVDFLLERNEELEVQNRTLREQVLSLKERKEREKKSGSEKSRRVIMTVGRR